MSCQTPQIFFLRHRGFSLGSCQNQGLRHIRQRILTRKRRRSTEHRTYTRTHIICDSRFIQQIHLLTNRPIHGWITRMQTHSYFTCRLCFLHDCHDIFQRHMRAVVDCAICLRIRKQFWIYKRTCIDDHVRFLNSIHTPHGDQITRTGSCSYEMYHLFSSFIYHH